MVDCASLTGLFGSDASLGASPLLRGSSSASMWITQADHAGPGREGRGKQQPEHQFKLLTNCLQQHSPCKILWLRARVSLAGEDGVTCAGLNPSSPTQAAPAKHTPFLLGFTCTVGLSGLTTPAPDLQRGAATAGMLLPSSPKRWHFSNVVQNSCQTWTACTCHGIRRWFTDNARRAPNNSTCFAKSFIFSACEWCQIDSIINRRLLFILQSRNRSANSVL